MIGSFGLAARKCSATSQPVSRPASWMSVKRTSMRAPAARRAIASSAVLDSTTSYPTARSSCATAHRTSASSSTMSTRSGCGESHRLPHDIRRGAPITANCDALSWRSHTVGTYDFVHCSSVSEVLCLLPINYKSMQCIAAPLAVAAMTAQGAVYGQHRQPLLPPAEAMLERRARTTMYKIAPKKCGGSINL
jgi:hypothetical protein